MIRANFLVLFVLASAAATAIPQAVHSADKQGPIKIFIRSGQSNMEGKTAASTFVPVMRDAETRDRFKHLKTDGE